jgi:hypothetical protein
VVAHAFNPCTQEAEVGGFLSSRPAWSTKWVPGQPGLYRETLSRKKKKKRCCGTMKGSIVSSWARAKSPRDSERTLGALPVPRYQAPATSHSSPINLWPSVT